MTEAVIEQAKVMSSYGKRNANTERIEKEEAELKLLIEGASSERQQKPEQAREEAEPENAEEKSFKKRYGDLRRHSQEQQNSFQKQIDELKSQLQQSTEQQIKMPKSEEELAAWVQAYPDVAKIVETIALKKAKEQSSYLEERFKALDEQEKQTTRQKAEADLLKAHPDFEKIKDTDEFHEWVEEQPKYIQDALYNNETDVRAASRAIDLYKADKNISRSSNKDAAASVGVRRGKSNPDSDNSDGSFKESQVNRMSIQEYEANQEAITKAIRSNKFVYDVTGASR
jgi:DNA repair exonuclease SbcCD ATPase subunit